MTPYGKNRVHEILPNLVKEHRLNRLWTQEELSRRSGVSTVSISFAEMGKCQPFELTQMKLAKALGVKREVLFPPKKVSPKKGKPRL